jgi:hypothetical protein
MGLRTSKQSTKTFFCRSRSGLGLAMVDTFRGCAQRSKVRQGGRKYNIEMNDSTVNRANNDVNSGTREV